MGCQYRGRSKIYATDDNITADNVWEVVKSAIPIHNANKRDMTYLYNYYKGDQPILYREKEIRPEINNKIVINRAYEIVTFKRGYLLTESIQYICKDDTGGGQSDSIKRLNGYMDAEGKDTKDSVLAEWMYITGTGYRIVLPKSWIGNTVQARDTNEAPFEFYTLDPRECFVAYSREVGNHPVFACVQSKPVDTALEDEKYTVYTPRDVYVIENGNVTSATTNSLGYIPIIEYPENNSRLGAFEIVLEILDSINLIESNALDDIEQTVQALLVLMGVDIETKDKDGNTVNTIDMIRAKGGIAIPDGADAKYLTMQLNQGSTKSLSADLETAWLEICGMPNRNGGSSTSDTGAAVQLRDGWSSAEVMAMNTQTMWEQSEREFLRIVLAIINTADNIDLTASDIIPHFNRQNAVNMQSKAQALGTLASVGLHMKDCIKLSGVAFDVETVYANYVAWQEEQEKKQVKELQESIKLQGEHTDGNAVEDKPDEEA